jgi:hypothetical protein
MNGMHCNVKLELMTHLEWGNAQNQLVPNYIAKPGFSLTAFAQQRKSYAPVRFRLDFEGRVYILNLHNDADVSQFSLTGLLPDGTVDSYRLFPHHNLSREGHSVVDFAVDLEGNCFILEQYKVNGLLRNSLAKFRSGGTLEWQREGDFSPNENDPDALKGFPDKVILYGERLLVGSSRFCESLAEMEPQTGQTKRVIALKHASSFGKFLAVRDTVAKVFYYEEKQAFAMSIIEPKTGQEQISIAAGNQFKPLRYAVGVDGRRNFLVHRLPGLSGRAGILKISFDEPAVETVLDFKDLVIRSGDQTIYSGEVAENHFRVIGYKNGMTSQWRFEWPPDLQARDVADGRLIRVDEGEHFYFHVGERVGTMGKIFKYTAAGELDEEIVPPFDLMLMATELQPFQYWQVDAQGRVYLPLLSADGFSLLRLTQHSG